VKVNSNIEKEWRWLEGNCNPADLGTRSKATPKDMIFGSEYQTGMPWMTGPEASWPCKKSFSPAPLEEIRKDMREGVCCVVNGEEVAEPDFPEVKKGGLDRLIRVYGYVMAAVYKWRKKTGASGPVIINGTQLPGGRVFGYPSIQCLQAAELFLLEKAQKGLKAARMRSLNVDTASEVDVNGITRKLVVIGSRGRNQIQEIYGQANLPVLDRDHKLSELYVQAAHEIAHEGTITTMHRSRKRVWVIHGRKLADIVKSRCTECRLKEKKVHGAEDGTPPRPQGSGGGCVPVRRHRPVWACGVPAARKEEAGGQGMGCGLCVYHNIRTARGVHGLVLYGQFSNGAQAVHEHQRNAHKVPVRQGRTAGGSRQAGGHVGFHGGRAVGRQKRDRMDLGAHGRPTLQRTS
jgi:hypothetical protein